MTRFRDCLISARDQGALTADEADRLAQAHEAEVRAAAARGEADPEAAGKAALAAGLDREAAQALRRKQLANATLDRLAEHARTYRGPDGRADVATAFEAVIENRNDLIAGTPSVVGRREALIARAHAGLEAGLYETRRKWTTGRRRGGDMLDNVAREAFGGDSGDAMAKGFLASWRREVDRLADEFNALGGDLPKRENYFPQKHEARLLLASGRAKWKADITPLLDVAKMRDPRTGGALTPARLDEALDAAFDSIVTDGAISRAPSTRPQGRGALANQRQEERFLEFRDGEAWLAYHRAYGGGDIYRTMMDHLHGLARDVAALDVLGPNPNATVTWMQSVIAQEHSRVKTGHPTLYRARVNDVWDSEPQMFLGRLWDVVNGTAVSPNKPANLAAGARNWLTAANLGGTALTAIATDPFQQFWARQFAGVPALRFLAEMPGQLLSKASRREIEQAGIIVADAMEQLRFEFGGYGLTAASREMTHWLPDRVFAWTGLTPWTNAARRAHAQAAMFQAGDHAADTLGDMLAKGGPAEKFARWLQGFGVDETEWAIIRAAQPLDHGGAGGMIRPVDVFDLGPRAREAGLRYSEAIHALMEEATPSGTARVRTIMGRDTRAGTLGGEAARSVTMYMTYPSTVMLSLINAVAHEFAQGAGRGIGFMFMALASLTAGGALLQQLQALRAGRDLKPVDDPLFWALSMAKGGGFSFYGDWLLADYKRGGGEQAARLAGPVVGFGADILATINPRGFFDDEDTNRAERAVQLARRNTPLLTAWPLRPFADRLLFDRLQEAANPRAHQAWRRQERRFEQEEGQGTFWRKGEALPHRAPDWSLF